MKKPRSQHARAMQALRDFAFDVYWRKRRLRELKEDTSLGKIGQGEYLDLRAHYLKSLEDARKGHARLLTQARAIRLAQRDPLMLGSPPRPRAVVVPVDDLQTVLDAVEVYDVKKEGAAQKRLQELVDQVDPPSPSAAGAAT